MVNALNRRTEGTPARKAPTAKAKAAPVKQVREVAPALTRTVYEDETGRRWSVLVPDGREEDAAMGVVVGPPDTAPLGLPEAMAVRLHNELYARGLLALADVRRRPQEVQAALMAALRLDMQAVQALYRVDIGGSNDAR